MEMNVLFAGHSFIRRLRDYIALKPMNLPIVDQSFCCQGGWKLPALRSAMLNLPNAQLVDRIIYIDIGTNDLSSSTLNLTPSQLADYLVDFATQLLSRGARCVILGEVLPRFGPALGMMGIPGPVFTNAVNEFNTQLRTNCHHIGRVTVWGHTRIFSVSLNPLTLPDTYAPDGVHLSDIGMKRYSKSIRGALWHVHQNM